MSERPAVGYTNLMDYAYEAFIWSLGRHGCIEDRQLGVRLNGKRPLFVVVIEYEYDMVIGYAYDMGLIHGVHLIHLVSVRELFYYSTEGYCSR